jgi:hypothetical protein
MMYKEPFYVFYYSQNLRLNMTMKSENFKVALFGAYALVY